MEASAGNDEEIIKAVILIGGPQKGKLSGCCDMVTAAKPTVKV